MTTTCFQGETITFSLADSGYSTVTAKVGTQTLALTKTGSTWSASLDTSAMSGRYRYAIFADGVVRDHGEFYAKPLVSKYRKAVEEIDEALRNHTESGLYSVTTEGLTLQNYSFDEMLKARSYYERLAEADENGGPARGPSRITEVYA